ncbi:MULTISPECIES: hypothetical protein [unclassified Phyllobacterium]|uniref:hypothetical protein n=1 Tax=unclassified Phyllobacterium TaxID=2638441 RepID=UPI003012FA04
MIKKLEAIVWCSGALLVHFVAFNEAKATEADCSALTSIYENTRNSGRYQVTFSEIEPGETKSKFLMDERFQDGLIYWQLGDGIWLERPRVPLDVSLTVFESCTKLDSKTIEGRTVDVYNANWRRGPREAKVVFYVTPETGLVFEATRRFTRVADDETLSKWKPGTTIIERFTYDRNLSAPPKPPLLPETDD